MLTQKIIVYSDYVCPFCLLAEEVLAEATKGLDVDIQWRPFELRPASVPTLIIDGETIQGVPDPAALKHFLTERA